MTGWIPGGAVFFDQLPACSQSYWLASAVTRHGGRRSKGSRVDRLDDRGRG